MAEKETTEQTQVAKPEVKANNGSQVTIISRANYSINVVLTNKQTVIVPPNGRIDVDTALVDKSKLSKELKLVGVVK